MELRSISNYASEAYQSLIAKLQQVHPFAYDSNGIYLTYEGLTIVGASLFVGTVAFLYLLHKQKWKNRMIEKGLAQCLATVTPNPEQQARIERQMFANKLEGFFQGLVNEGQISLATIRSRYSQARHAYHDHQLPEWKLDPEPNQEFVKARIRARRKHNGGEHKTPMKFADPAVPQPGRSSFENMFRSLRPAAK
jgi:hypothetical protein